LRDFVVRWRGVTDEQATRGHEFGCEFHKRLFFEPKPLNDFGEDFGNLIG
jgi:hypothetical protein